MLTIYKASAGSGKTFTLALEYIKLLLGIKSEADASYRLNMPKYNGGRRLQSRHRHILAITFTNKATEEMKSRIVNELARLASDIPQDSKDSEYASKLIKAFGCTRDELRDCSAMALKEMLFDYHHFNVSTIDSFFQTVLRSFAREVDRQGDYAIEINDEYAVVAGIGLMLDDLNYGNPARRRQMLQWISRYTMELVESGKDGSMFNRSGALIRSLTKYVRRMSSETFKRSSDEVLAYLEQPQLMAEFAISIRNHIADINKGLKPKAEALEAQFAGLGFDPQALPSYVWTVINAAKAGDPVDPVKAFGSKGMSKILDWQNSGDTSFYTKKYLPAAGKPKTTVFPPDSFSSALATLMHDCRRAAVEIHVLNKIIAACPNLEFLGFTWHYINRFRAENNLILLSDTNDLLQRIIGTSSTPFVYERIGVTLNHFLIDEFQDTSHMQWDNLKPLVENSLATDNDNLIIGDEKQAIYRFRNSDSSLLHHIVMERDFPDNHRLQGLNAVDNTNHRSAAGIVRFNNTVFDRIARSLNLVGYENTIQSISKHGQSHLVRIYDCSDAEKIDSYPAELEIIAQQILRQHKAGYRWADIAVLVRYTDEAKAVVKYLLNHHPEINVLSDEALLLRNSPAVKLVVSILKLVDDSYSSLSDKNLNDTVGKANFGSIADTRMMISRFEYFIASGHDVDRAISLALEDSHGMSADDITDNIADIRSQHPSGLVSLVETIIAKKISDRQRKLEYAYLAAFQDEVIKYCSAYNPSVHSFLQWWKDASNSLAISSDSATDAVAVMTIHKSKGLQWQCVHIPFADWQLVRDSDTIWLKPDMLGYVKPSLLPPLLAITLDSKCAMEGSPLCTLAQKNRAEQLVDNINTTYVAYTRAKRELIVCFATPKEAAAKVLEVINSPALSSEDPERCVDLAQYLSPDCDDPRIIFQYGGETQPVDDKDSKPSAVSVEDAGVYRSFFRDDISKYVSIDDAYARLDIDDRPLQPSTDAQTDKMRLAAERGTKLHAILAEMDNIDDLGPAVKKAATRFCLTEQQAGQYKKIIENALSEYPQHISRWFGPDATVLKEQSIYLPEGDLTMRPDRIVICKDGTDIVDYKFTTDVQDDHYDQVAAYVRALRAMGCTNVKGYLWYPELNKIKPVTI